jgi:hypothetical protein
MNDPELISDTGFSACDSGLDAASVVTAWGAPAVASDGQGDVLAALPAGAQSGVRDGRAACVVVAVAQ